ncbi:facilitated trehalose transporter Tret1-like [Contarinia nasturtii]|uniref:facilitated trehalose transporter Tret1-like n=1 Tax=Contarinia nasturtii TaxID=265458 RepID=UPI0012D46998|nr:facilitated trehalose transporter Tret1-like [Contarinia nasturtii]XP_031619028.1 facilitated trehalose transporter Tret1-like [Contarinia nasturtii]
MLKFETNTVQMQSAKYQYVAAFVVNLLSIASGVTGGWSSPNIILLMSDETPLPSGRITMEQCSWLVSFLYMGGVFGNIIFGFVTNRFGRKWPLIIMTIPMMISWLLILYSQNIYYIYASRILNGIIGGGLFIIIPLFLSEIAIDRVRGVLGSTLILAENIGILLAFILGHFCDYYTTPKVVIALMIICSVLLFFFPESPPFLMKQNQVLEAEKSIHFYQNLNGNNANYELLQIEMSKLQSMFADMKTESSLTWSDLTTHTARKAITIGVVLAALNQFCGCFAMFNYTSYVFEEAGSNFTPNESAIVIGFISLFGSFLSTNLVDRAGRKILFAISSVGTALGLIVLGIYVMLKSWNYQVETLNWIPMVSFSFVVFIASLGLMTLPFVVISEIMPEKIKDFSVSFCMIILWTLTFIMVKWLPLLTESFEFYRSMFLFAAVCVLGYVFIFFYVPETKSKSYEQIMDSLR